MITIKTSEEIEKMKRGGKILSEVLSRVAKACVAGASTEELDRIAKEGIESAGGKPSFLHYQISPEDPQYPSTVCISINDEVVHGLATPNRIIKDGDLVGLDIGMWFPVKDPSDPTGGADGLATDMAATVCVGNVSSEARKLSEATRESLKRGLSVVKDGVWVHEIGKTIEEYLKPMKYGIIKDLCGHGVGHAVHEDPQIPNYHERRARPVKLKAGMCIAIEPMIALGSWRVKQKDDGWTFVTADGSLAAHWEVTIAVTKNGFEMITPWPDISVISTGA
ncbi:MAG: type I methionyl aminopeptidase [Patescibacteria group bacterium]|nr:type I methionyl aminopeptidase [Patescibacteria group bacterium]